MIVRRLLPPNSLTIDLDAPSADAELAELYRPPRAEWVRLNLVTSVSGSAAGADGTSDTLSSRADRMLLKIIRRLADVVVVGAQSVRAEGYYVPQDAALAVLTRSGDFTGHRIVGSGKHGPLIVLCPESAVATVRRTLPGASTIIMVLPDVEGTIAPRDIVEWLHHEGFSGIVCEGGPSLAAQFLDSGMLDEVCLTVSPVINGGTLPPFGSAELSARRLTLSHLLLDESSFLFSRWQVADRRATA